jgi:hypothetical protein
MRHLLITICASMVLASAAQAGYLTPASVSGTGTFNHSITLLSDGTIVAQQTDWQNASNVWWNGTGVTFTYNLGSIKRVEDLVFSADNNDQYEFAYSTDNITFTTLMISQVSYGEIGFGMDTMSTFSGDPQYISQLDFAPVNAQYVRFRATGGDNSYAFSEVAVYGSELAAVPAPPTLLLMGLGLASAIATRRSWLRAAT